MLNVITDTFKPNEKVDPLFGVVKFRRTFGFIGAGFWQGKVNFAPLGKLVDIYFTAGKGGILETQRDFYRQVEQRYAEIIDRTHKILYETLHQYMPTYCSEYTREEIVEDCELVSIQIPNFSEPNAEWSLSFMYTPHKQSYSIYFDDWKPIYGLFDD
jgi:hypothetical protein